MSRVPVPCALQLLVAAPLTLQRFASIAELPDRVVLRDQLCLRGSSLLSLWINCTCMTMARTCFAARSHYDVLFI